MSFLWPDALLPRVIEAPADVTALSLVEKVMTDPQGMTFLDTSSLIIGRMSDESLVRRYEAALELEKRSWTLSVDRPEVLGVVTKLLMEARPACLEAKRLSDR